jgi:hypothetical protein
MCDSLSKMHEGVPVRLMTMGRMSISIPDQWWRLVPTRGVYLLRISCTVWVRLSSVRNFHSPV